MYLTKAFSNKLFIKNILTVSMKHATIDTVRVICGCGGTGRRAGLRNQCQRRGGSSPLIRTKKRKQVIIFIENYLFLCYYSEI